MEDFNNVLIGKINDLPAGKMKTEALNVLSQPQKIEISASLRCLQFLINMEPKTPAGQLAALVMAYNLPRIQDQNKLSVLNNLGLVAQKFQSRCL